MREESFSKRHLLNKVIFWDQIFVPIYRSLGNQKKTYIGDHWHVHRQSYIGAPMYDHFDVWMNYLYIGCTSERRFGALRCMITPMYVQPYLRCLKGIFIHWSSNVRTGIPTNMHNYTLTKKHISLLDLTSSLRPHYGKTSRGK